MSATPRVPLVNRVPPGAWMVLLWCAAIACTLGVPGLPLIGGHRHVVFGGGLSSISWQFLAPGADMVLSALLLRRRPLTALAVLLAPSLAAVAIPGPKPPVLFLPVVPVSIAVCVIAATRPRRVSVGSAAVAAGVLCGRGVVRLLASGTPVGRISPGALTDSVVIVLVAAVAWLIGYAIRQNRSYADELRAHAVTAERLRIARDVHDMVAHSIGIIAIQAGAGSRVIGTQPAIARDALTAIEATSRDTLAGLRRMLGTLRGAEHQHQAGPLPPGAAPGLAGVGQLTATAVDAGVCVDVQWRGQRRQLPAEIDAAAFRIIQEAVTNVVRHAGTSVCQVIIDQRGGELAIEVTDDGRGGAVNGTGYGIAGMRERAALLHGQLVAGPRPDGGFRVAARLPLPAPVR